MQKNREKVFKIAMPGIGLLFLGYLIGAMDPSEVGRNLAVLKWSFPLALGLACTWHITNSIAWSFAFSPEQGRPKLRSLFMAKLAGEAVSQLTPLSQSWRRTAQGLSPQKRSPGLEQSQRRSHQQNGADAYRNRLHYARTKSGVFPLEPARRPPSCNSAGP